MKKCFVFLLALIFLINFVSAIELCEEYNPYIRGLNPYVNGFNTTIWNISQDPEGQPFTTDYGFYGGATQFLINSNTTTDSRTYLVSQHDFIAGEFLRYRGNLISKEGNYGSPIIIVGEECSRCLITAVGYNNGTQGYDELGISNVTIAFTGNNFIATSISPSGVVIEQEFFVQNSSGDYRLYIGAFSGHNGKIRELFTNFELCREEVEEQTIEEQLEELRQQIDDLENRTSLIEVLIEQIIDFLKTLPKGLSGDFYIYL